MSLKEYLYVLNVMNEKYVLYSFKFNLYNVRVKSLLFIKIR